MYKITGAGHILILMLGLEYAEKRVPMESKFLVICFNVSVKLELRKASVDEMQISRGFVVKLELRKATAEGMSARWCLF